MRCSTLIILFLFRINLPAQQHNSYTFRHIDQSDGLLHNNVIGIRQDAKGFIWILTPNGLQRYDGTRFISYQGIVNNPIHGITNGAELTIDKNKNEVWVMKGNILEKLNLYNNRLTTYEPEQVLKDTSFKFNSYTDESGNSWLLSDKGLVILSAATKRPISVILNLRPPGIREGNKLATDSQQNQAWMVAQNGLVLLNGNTGKVFSKRNNLLNEALLKNFLEKKSSARLAMIDSRGDFWVSTWGSLFYRFNPKTGKLNTYDLPAIKKRHYDQMNTDATLLINAMLEDNHGNVWLATENAGLLLYHRDTDNFEDIIVDKINTQSIQYNFKINCIFQDKDENIWLGTDKGISAFNPYRQYFRTIRHEEKKQSLPNKEILNYIETNTGNLLVGTWGGGITVYDGQWNFKKNITFSNDDQNMVWCFIENDVNEKAIDKKAGNVEIWAGCQHGYIHIYDPANEKIKTIHPPELSGSTIRCMTKDGKGNIWLGLHNGKIAQWIREQHKFYAFNADSLSGQMINAPVFNIFIDKAQRIWVSTGNGFKEFDPGKKIYSHIYLPEKNKPQSISGISSQGIETYDDTTLLIGSVYGGLNFFNTKTRAFSHLTTNDGLPSNSIYAIKKDDAGYVWFTTDYNLYKFKPPAKVFLHYNIEPGLINSSFNSTGFYAMENGEWLTASTKEIICFQPKTAIQTGKNTRVEITGFKVFDNPVFIDSLIDQNKPLLLSYKQNFFTVEFALLDFSALQQPKYYYRLSDINKDWVESNTKNFASYTNLNPGEYVFSVKVENGSGISAPASFTIIILPPFWQTWWFKSIVCGCALLLIYLLVKWREKSIKVIETEKLKVQQLSAEQYKSKLELEQIINYFSSSLIDKNTVDDVLWDVAKNLIGRLGFVDCMIYLWNNDKTKMIQKAGFGPKGSIEGIREQPFDVVMGQGVVGYVMQTKESLVIPDTSKDSRYRTDEMQRLSEITVPVIYNNELIGVIDSEHHEKNFYSAQHLQILSTIATLMANKIKAIEADQLLQRTHIEMYSMNEQLSKAKLEALRAQMNPHFIFNCLTSIDNLIQMDEKEKATLYLSKFAKLIRSILENSINNVVPCWKDIETLKLYLELEALRFDNRFSYNLIISDEILNGDYKVPTLVIQPFVENAIHHGLLNKIDGDKELTIRVSVVNNHIHYLIEDNGVGRAKANAYKQLNKPSQRSMGMQITTDRISLFNQHKNGSVIITDMVDQLQQPCGTRVAIELVNQS